MLCYLIPKPLTSECSEISQHSSNTPEHWVITQISCKSVGKDLPTQPALVQPLVMHVDDGKFEKKNSHKRKAAKGMRGRNASCTNISKKPFLLQAPTEAREVGAGLGKPLLGVALKRVCSLVIEHVFKYVH